MNKRQSQLDAATRIANRHADLHPWAVAVAACNWASKADFDAFLCGMLHDSLEDGYATIQELDEADIPDVVVRATIALTRSDGEKYADYIQRIKVDGSDAGRLARKVKLADATVNLERCTSDFGYGSLEKRYRMVIEELS